GGLQVAVHDPLLVQRGERAEHRQRDLDGVTGRQRPAGEAVAERLPVEELHREKQAVAVFVDLVELADVRMADARGGARLAPEALPLLAAGVPRTDALDGDRTVQAVVMRGVDDTHAAFPELA